MFSRIKLPALYAVTAVAALLLSVLIFLLAVHIFIPPRWLNAHAPALGEMANYTFGTGGRLYPRGQPLDAIQKWVDVCRVVDKEGRKPQENVLYENISNLVYRMDSDQASASQFIENTNGNNTFFSLLTVALGMLTTIIAAIKTSEFGKQEGRRAEVLNIVSVALPAIVTAVAAITPLYVNAETSARKAQMNSAIIDLATSISSELVTLNCLSGENSGRVATEMGKWNKNYASILISSLSATSKDVPAHQ